MNPVPLSLLQHMSVQFLITPLSLPPNLLPALLRVSLVVFPLIKFLVCEYSSKPIGKNEKVAMIPTKTAIKIEKSYGTPLVWGAWEP